MVDWDKVTTFMRSAQRPWLVFLFPLTAVIIAILITFTLMPAAVKFVDREIALVIIVALLFLVTNVATATTTIMAFLFGERGSKKKEEKQ